MGWRGHGDPVPDPHIPGLTHPLAVLGLLLPPGARLNRMVPALPPNVPRRHKGFLQRVGRLGMRLMRWRVEGMFPDLPKFVIIVGPHTSNWDFVTALFCDLALDLKAGFLAKHTIFVGPF